MELIPGARRLFRSAAHSAVTKPAGLEAMQAHGTSSCRRVFQRPVGPGLEATGNPEAHGIGPSSSAWRDQHVDAFP